MKSSLIENRQIRVFISSTFRDMQDERDYLMKRTFPKLRKLAEERDVTLTELDLRWGITEEEAKSGKVVEICLKEIDNSVPFFIGIIGQRYGWCPTPDDIFNGRGLDDCYGWLKDDLNNGLSVTEIEMQYGVLRRKDKVNAFFYLKENDESSCDEPEKLAKLKRKVKESCYPSSIYNSIEDLSQQVEGAFTALLNKLFPEGNITEHEKKRITQRSYLNTLCQTYIRDLHNFDVLNEFFSNDEQHQLVVTGDSGLGKSALIANWTKEKLACGCNIIYYFVGNGNDVGSHYHLMKYISDEIMRIYDINEVTDYNSDDTKKLEILFSKVAADGKRLVIVLDAINQIIDVEDSKLLNWLPVPPQNIKIIFTTLLHDRTMDVFNTRHYPIFELQPLDFGRRRELVICYLSKYGKRLTDNQVARIISDSQCENTLVLRTLLDELLNFGVFELLDQRIEHYLHADSVEDFYQSLLITYEDEYGCEFIKTVFSFIAVSRLGLNETELLGVSKVAPLHWSQLYCAFHSHFNVKNGLIAFSHSYILEAVRQRYIYNDKSWENECRESIIQYMTGEYTQRILQELAFQYYMTGDMMDLHNLLLVPNVLNFYYFNDGNTFAEYWKCLLADETGNYALSDYLYEDFEDSQDSIYALYCLSMFTNLIMLDVEVAKKSALMALDMYARIQGDVDKTLYCELLDLMANVYSTESQFADAEQYLLKSLDEKIKLYGEDSNAVARSYQFIGNNYYSMAKYEKALECDNKALELYSLHDNVEHEKAQTRGNIALVQTALGNYELALEENYKVHEIYIKLLGTNSNQLPVSYNNIGLNLKALGRYQEAIDNFQKAIDLGVNLYGNHFNMLPLITSNKILTYLSLREYDKAMEEANSVLNICINLYGECHSYTSGLYNILGNIYLHKGNYNESIKWYEKSLDINLKLYGELNDKLSTDYNNIGLAYTYLGEYDKAFSYNGKALDILKSIYGEKHPEYARTMMNKALILQSQNKYAEALKLNEMAVEINFQFYGEDNPEVANCILHIAETYITSGEYKNALSYYLKLLKIQQNLYGNRNKSTLQTVNFIANCYNQLGDFDNALKYYADALEGFIALNGEIDMYVGMLYNNIGYLYANHLILDKGLDNLNKAIEIWSSKEAYSEQGQALAKNNLALIYSKRGDYKKALDNFLYAGKVYKQILSPNDPNLATILCNIGNTYSKLGDFDNAMKYVQQSLDIRTADFGYDNMETAESRMHLAYIYYYSGQIENSLNLYLELNDYYIRTLGPDNLKLATVTLSIGNCYKELGNASEAIKYFEETLRIYSHNPDNVNKEDIEFTENARNGCLANQ